MKYVVILFLVAIVYNLGAAFFHLIRSTKGTDQRVVQKLTLRVALSMGLFLLLMVSYKMGWIGEKL